MKILVLNGPNLNMLGIREPEIYGTETYGDLLKRIETYCAGLDITVRFEQSNHEGALVDAVQQCCFDGTDGIVINAGAYSHTSIALADAIRAVRLPAVEVHISDPETREPFRHISFLRPVCIGTVSGHGTNGYLEAVELLRACLLRGKN